MSDLRTVSLSCKIAAVIGLFYIAASIVFAVSPEAFVSALDWESRTGHTPSLQSIL